MIKNIIIAVLAVLSLVFFLYAFLQKLEADKSRAMAQEMQQMAIQNEMKAIQASKESERQMAMAQQARMEAERQKGLAEENARLAKQQRRIAEANREKAVESERMARAMMREAELQRLVADQALRDCQAKN
jgi:hypothetical protein